MKSMEKKPEISIRGCPIPTIPTPQGDSLTAEAFGDLWNADLGWDKKDVFQALKPRTCC